MGRQLLRCATWVGANYRAACRGQSRADVLVKLAIVEQEADESLYWLEMLVDSRILAGDRAACLVKEGQRAPSDDGCIAQDIAKSKVT